MLEGAEGFDFGVELIHHVLEFWVDFELVDDFAGAGGAGGDFDAAVAGGGGADAEDFAEFVLLVEFGFGILLYYFEFRSKFGHEQIRLIVETTIFK